MGTFLQIKDNIIDFLVQLKPVGSEAQLLSIGALLGFLFSVAVGGMDRMIYALIALCTVDYCTGMINAFKTGAWDSSVGFRGILKKFIIFAVVALCNCIDTAMAMHTLRQMAIGAYALNEAGSILENVDHMGYGKCIPEFIRSALARLNDKSKAGDILGKGVLKK